MAEQKQKKQQTGVVVSNRMDKTIVVEATRLVRHPVYKKYVKKRVRFYAHDESNDAGIGDTVTIQESRPLSKKKRWILSNVDERATLV